MIKKIFTKKTKAWLKAALVRAVKTFAQVFTSFITVGLAISEINWEYILSVSTVAFVLSIMTSLAGLPEVSEEGDDGEN